VVSGVATAGAIELVLGSAVGAELSAEVVTADVSLVVSTGGLSAFVFEQLVSSIATATNAPEAGRRIRGDIGTPKGGCMKQKWNRKWLNESKGVMRRGDGA
jgi:hypothetical protein